MTQPEHRRHAHAPLRHILDGPTSYLCSGTDTLRFSSPNLSDVRIEGNGLCPKFDEGFGDPNLALCRV